MDKVLLEESGLPLTHIPKKPEPARIAAAAKEMQQLPAPQLGEFPIISHVFMIQKIVGKFLVGMGAAFYGFTTTTYYAFFNDLQLDAFNLFPATLFVSQGALMYAGHKRVMSKLKDSLNNLTEQGTLTGWQHWAARKWYNLPNEQVLNNLNNYIAENTSYVSRNPNYPHIFGRSFMRTIEATARPAQGKTCLDVIVFSGLGFGSARRCGEDLLSRLAELEKQQLLAKV